MPKRKARKAQFSRTKLRVGETLMSNPVCVNATVLGKTSHYLIIPSYVETQASWPFFKLFSFLSCPTISSKEIAKIEQKRIVFYRVSSFVSNKSFFQFQGKLFTFLFAKISSHWFSRVYSSVQSCCTV